MKVIVVLRDGSRHDIDVDAAVVVRGKFEFSPPGTPGASPIGVPMPLALTVCHCYRAGSDDGVPVFVER